MCFSRIAIQAAVERVAKRANGGVRQLVRRDPRAVRWHEVATTISGANRARIVAQNEWRVGERTTKRGAQTIR